MMLDDQGRPYVYLAGPDVFYPDALIRAGRMKAILADNGMAGLFPMDNEFDIARYANKQELGLAIAEANEAMMLKSEIIIANVQPWRGPEADDGTAYEIGFMAAHNKFVMLYTDDPRPFATRVIEDTYQGKVHADAHLIRSDNDNMMIEDFPAFADNLMLVNAAVRSVRCILGDGYNLDQIIQPSFEDAVQLVVTLWNNRHRGVSRSSV